MPKLTAKERQGKIRAMIKETPESHQSYLRKDSKHKKNNQ